jgi:hypothetical protein
MCELEPVPSCTTAVRLRKQYGKAVGARPVLRLRFRFLRWLPADCVGVGDHNHHNQIRCMVGSRTVAVRTHPRTRLMQ